jgi:hypothetical protein
VWTQSTLQQSKAKEHVKEHESAVLQEAHESTWQESKVKAHQNAVLQEAYHRASAARTNRLTTTPKKQDAN